jgi:hypothetical protein
MPLPKPKDDETQKQWIDRCMSNEAMKKEFPDNDQRLAVCYEKWRDKEKEGASAEPERRYFPFEQTMRASEEDGKLIIEGYAIVYNQYAPIFSFREIIRPGAATEVLKSADELVLWDHESSQPMARRSAGTLEVKEDEKGVFIRADVSKTVWGRNGHEAIKNKVITKMSFAFDLNGGLDKWSKEEIEGVLIETREILAFGHLYDYSPVSYPAYQQTSVSARALELATRNRPEPGDGEGGAGALEEARAGQAAIVRERIVSQRKE